MVTLIIPLILEKHLQKLVGDDVPRHEAGEEGEEQEQVRAVTDAVVEEGEGEEDAQDELRPKQRGTRGGHLETRINGQNMNSDL
jgi:hypothetical protein